METALHIVAAVRRLDFPDRPEHAVARCASRPQKQQVCHAVLVDLVGNIRVLKQCLDLRAKHQTAGNLRIKQGLYADAVTCQKEPLGGVFPDGKGEDAVALFHTAWPPVGVGLENDLGVAVGLKNHALLFQLCAQFRRVVKLAVVDDGIGLAAGGDLHGLSALFHVNDRQACVRHGTVWREKNALLIRTSAAQGLLHFAQQRLLLPQVLFQMYHAGDSAHKITSVLCCHRDTILVYAEKGKILQTASQKNAVPGGFSGNGAVLGLG